ncbi:MAG TPA: hypothetical protein VEF34_17205 [Syntrophobacteraceae bacterium]|nr:hypothetical protein [Syntrophobacteraceae bacterium]
MRYAKNVVCDFCGAETENVECWPPDSGRYCVNEVTIRLRTGEDYIESSRGKTFTVDMCPKCFVEKLVPWFESQGARVREENWHE